VVIELSLLVLRVPTVLVLAVLALVAPVLAIVPASPADDSRMTTSWHTIIQVLHLVLAKDLRTST